MRTLEGVLAKHPFFGGLDPRYLETGLGCASNVRFNAGDFIFQQGDEANHFYLIREGKVSLEVFAPGRGSLTVQTLTGGDILGWSWLGSAIQIDVRRSCRRDDPSNSAGRQVLARQMRSGPRARVRAAQACDADSRSGT
ncbi:MAG: cyclic nucleotide-binding domain-containing protein [Mycobacterium sp.]|nr:cyclic nucleotide-binding domain-containing protein [Mycobacterium sp.]